MKKLGKYELKARLQTQTEVQSLMTVLMQHMDKSCSDTEKLATIGAFALAWYDSSTYNINQLAKQLMQLENAND